MKGDNERNRDKKGTLWFSQHIVKLPLPPHIKGKLRISRKNDKVVNIMIKIQILLQKAIDVNCC